MYVGARHECTAHTCCTDLAVYCTHCTVCTYGVYCIYCMMYVVLSDSINSSIIAIVKVHSAGLCQVSGASYSVKLNCLNLILCFFFTINTSYSKVDQLVPELLNPNIS